MINLEGLTKAEAIKMLKEIGDTLANSEDAIDFCLWLSELLEVNCGRE